MDNLQRVTLFENENKRRMAWDGIAELVKEAHNNALDHGFYEASQNAIRFMQDSGAHDAVPSIRRDFIFAQLAKIGSEAGEAVGALQHGDESKMLEELADIMIRVLDLAGYVSMPQEFAGVLINKMEFNIKRPYLHGKKA